MTYTYAILDVSPEAHQEIHVKLKAAGYQRALHEDGVIDMHGIALRAEKGSKPDAEQWLIIQAGYKALRRDGNVGAFKLALQLAGFAPCPGCDYIKEHCRCSKETS